MHPLFKADPRWFLPTPAAPIGDQRDDRDQRRNTDKEQPLICGHLIANQ